MEIIKKEAKSEKSVNLCFWFTLQFKHISSVSFTKHQDFEIFLMSCDSAGVMVPRRDGLSVTAFTQRNSINHEHRRTLFQNAALYQQGDYCHSRSKTGGAEIPK